MSVGRNNLNPGINTQPVNTAKNAAAQNAGEVQNLFADSLSGARENSTGAKGLAYTGGTKTAEELVNYSLQLYNAMAGFGTDKKTVNNIIKNGGLNSYDTLGLLATYSSVTGRYLADDITKNFYGNTRKNLLQTLAKNVQNIITTETQNEKNGNCNVLALSKAKTQASLIAPYLPQTDKESLNIATSTMVTGLRG